MIQNQMRALGAADELIVPLPKFFVDEVNPGSGGIHDYLGLTPKVPPVNSSRNITVSPSLRTALT